MNELTSHYAGTFGVVNDVEGNNVSIDPDFDAQWWQRFTEASVVYDRQAAAVDVLSARALDAWVMEAVMAWHGEPPTPASAEMYLATEKSRRAQLSAALTGAGASNTIRSGVIRRRLPARGRQRRRSDGHASPGQPRVRGLSRCDANSCRSADATPPRHLGIVESLPVVTRRSTRGWVRTT